MCRSQAEFLGAGGAPHSDQVVSSKWEEFQAQSGALFDGAAPLLGVASMASVSACLSAIICHAQKYWVRGRTPWFGVDAIMFSEI